MPTSASIDALRRWLRRIGLRFNERSRLDWPLLLALLLLCAVGLAVLYSASGGNQGLVLRQAMRIAAGFAILLLVARLPPPVLGTFTPALYVASLLLLAVLLLLGEGRGAQRWLDLGVVRFQPSEILKLTLPMMVAWLFHGRLLPPSWPLLAAAGLVIALPVALIVVQPDLGTAILVGAGGLFAVFFAGMAWRRIALLVGLLVASVPLVWPLLHDYQRARVLTLFDPEQDPLGQGWNIIQSKIAVGSGGWLGKGWQMSTQARLEFLPERNTDFILAVFAEEFGWLGVALLLALYLFIIGRGLWIAAQARDTYSRLLGGALVLVFFVYVVVNAGMVSGILPVVGVPLPLVSYGGTSAISLLAGFGILMSIHGHRKLLTPG